MNVLVFFDEVVARVLVEYVVENFPIRIDDLQQFVRVGLLPSRIKNCLHVGLCTLKIAQEIIHVVSLINKHRLLPLFDEKLVFVVFLDRVRHVAEVFITKEGV